MNIFSLNAATIAVFQGFGYLVVVAFVDTGLAGENKQLVAYPEY